MKTQEMKLDGNAIGGLLLELFGWEMTDATAVCRSCGAEGPMACLDVYVHAPGTVVRCRTCQSVVMRFVRAGERWWLDLGGAASFELRP